ncbi:DNA adenine methylase [Caudoviricetes sp.]|nr:DNA adenine methylase [Caudoviricetes sp.]
MVEALWAPFPWPGGKSRIAAVAWRALDPQCVNYIEPFFGSGAMLLGRPGGSGKIETVNDLDGSIVNFWRAIKAAPDAVAEWCDDPVSELDLHARHAWLVARLQELADQLRADPHYYDAKIAGWWVHGICQWIGTGWCSHGVGWQQKPDISTTGDRVGMGVLSQKLPNLSGNESGVRKRSLSNQLPPLRVNSGASGNGILSSALPQKMPSIAVPGPAAQQKEAGRGVHSKAAAERFAGLPAIGNDRGINAISAPPCQAWFRALQERLRRVRIVCGDWTRVLGNSVLGKGKNVGRRRPCAVFLDPPYDVSMRAKRIYRHDAEGLSTKVRDWCREHGADPDLRIILCGYADEHASLLEHGWKAHGWKGARGYAAEDNSNRENETLFLSPHCLPLTAQRSLFEVSNG